MTRRVAYADPPYLGVAAKHYAAHHKHAVDYDDPATHAALIHRLDADFDAWALSLSTPSLRTILPMCPPTVRVMAWVKPFASFKPGVNPAYAWEPVIVKCDAPRSRTEPTVRDWVASNITLEKGLAGAKPVEFSFWLFSVLALAPDDEFVDVFPGTGAVTAAHRAWLGLAQQAPLFELEAVGQ